MLSTQIEQENLELILNLPHDLNCNVKADEERLRQVLVNLLGNALKFTDNGHIELKVSWIDQPQKKNRKTLLFEVIDTGCGIAPEDQAHIFDSFTQVDSSTTRTHGGTGLGLAISSHLVALMGGKLAVKSQSGAGSCFYFSLDLEFTEALHHLDNTDILENRKILIADDNATNRLLLNAQLSALKMQCRTVENGETALKELIECSRSGQPYQCLLIDYQMPGMDGLTTSLAIRAEPRITPLSVILMGSTNTAPELGHYDQYGINFFLNKPITQKNLLHTLLVAFAPERESSELHRTLAINGQVSQLTGHILLAEDNLINQEVAKGILKVIGCETTIANNGAEAVNLSAKTAFDLILMDCHMPGMDGFEASAKIRLREQEEKLNHIPIIALTADVQKGVIEQCLSAGMDGYLSKPYTRRQLEEMLKQWLPLTPKKPAHEISNPTRYGSHERSKVMQDIVILDQNALDNLRPLTTPEGENLLDKAIMMFMETAPEEVVLLQKAAKENDPSQLAKISHNFKSSCGNLGATALAKKAANLEAIGRQGQMHGVDEIISSIANELPLVINALRKEMTVSDGSFFFSTDTSLTPNPNAITAKILIVDDDPNFRDLTGAALRSAGFIVEEVGSGKEAIRQVNRQLPDLILLDANMPELDGFVTCRQLKRDPALTDIPIIVVTGLDDVDSINSAFEAGASDFIPKPINYSVLIQRINFGLRTGQVTAELRNSKLQLSAAQRIARLGYWTWDTQRDIFTISEQLAELVGIDLTTFGGSLVDFINLIHPKDREFVRDVINAAGHSKAIQHIEYRINGMAAEIIEVQQEIEALTTKNQLFVTGIVQDISHKKQAEKQIHRLAYFDHLTGLANRSYYQERMENIIKSAQQRKSQFAFLFIDMDGFKNINDTYGHHIGDMFLQEIAQRLKLVAREIDFIVRMGGDEFCIILNNITEEATVAEIAKRCLQKLEQPLILDNQQIKPKASIGISLFPKDGNTEEEILKAADTAMYMAKQTGKHRFIFYSVHMANQVKQRQQKENMLREASAKEQFVLVYQPQVSLETGKIVGVEALARWQHPEKGIISPSDFINLAEQLGLITQLGHWAIKTACEQIAEWQKADLPYIQVGVNISPTYLQDPSLIDSIQSILQYTNVPAECLQLEITENGLQNVSRIEIFNQLRALGVKIAIDDFGSGFSSLASLKQLPLDSLKIDKMFIEDLLINPHTPLLLGTIIGLANALNFTLVAEGVENKEQAKIMMGLGCRVMQGYLFSRPVPGKDIPALYSTDFILDNLGDYIPGKIA